MVRHHYPFFPPVFPLYISREKVGDKLIRNWSGNYAIVLHAYAIPYARDKSLFDVDYLFLSLVSFPSLRDTSPSRIRGGETMIVQKNNIGTFVGIGSFNFAFDISAISLCNI